MATKTIKQLDADARKLVLDAKAVLDDRDNRTPEEVTGALKSLEDADGIVKQLETLTGVDSLKTLNRLENSLAALQASDPPHITAARGSDGTLTDRHGRAVAIKTAGQEFIESEAFQGWLKAVAPSGSLSPQQPILSPAIEIKTLYTMAGDRTASGPLLGQPDRRGEIVKLGLHELVLRSLISNLTTASDTVEVVREKTRTSAAATVAEATATSDGSGAAPESALEWEVVQATVKDIAHFVPATANALNDASRLRGEIDAFLREEIDQKLEALILTGNASEDATQFNGIYNTTGIDTEAFATDVLTTTRKARTTARFTNKTTPTAWLFHPADWEDLDLTQDAQDRYYFGGPLAMGVQRLWGLPIIESAFATEGLALLGRWTDAVIYDRQQTTVQISNQHSDFFIRRLVAILGVMRAAFHVRRPKSFLKVDLTA